MHRIITNAPLGTCVDHKNGNTLDNRRENLRLATTSQNSINQKLRRDNTSGVKGVYWDKKNKKFKAQISLHGKAKSLGRFSTKEEAAYAYAVASEHLHGEFRRSIT